MVEIVLRKPERDSTTVMCQWSIEGSRSVVEDCVKIVQEVSKAIQINTMKKPSFDRRFLYKKLLGLAFFTFATDGKCSVQIRIETVKETFKVFADLDTFPAKTVSMMEKAKDEDFKDTCLQEAITKFGLTV